MAAKKKQGFDMNLKKLAAEYGVANLAFFIPMSRLQHVGIIPGFAFRSSDSPVQRTECRIDESRYTVADGYKITLAAVDPMFGKDSFYQSDLQSIMEGDPLNHQVYVMTIDGYQSVDASLFI
jgi:hypothetical protein